MGFLKKMKAKQEDLNGFLKENKSKIEGFPPIGGRMEGKHVFGNLFEIEQKCFFNNTNCAIGDQNNFGGKDRYSVPTYLKCNQVHFIFDNGKSDHLAPALSKPRQLPT